MRRREKETKLLSVQSAVYTTNPTFVWDKVRVKARLSLWKQGVARLAKARQRARGWGVRRREARRGEARWDEERGGEKRHRIRSFVPNERYGTELCTVRLVLCVYVCVCCTRWRRRQKKREEEMRREERERKRERARSRYALPTGATTPVTFVRSVLRPGPARFHRLLPPGGTTMRINPPPANLLPARLSNLCPVSARIGDRSNGLLEPLAPCERICTMKFSLTDWWVQEGAPWKERSSTRELTSLSLSLYAGGKLYYSGMYIIIGSGIEIERQYYIG